MAGIYIHIPFCKKACHYCDFHFSTSLKYKEAMIEALCKELVLRKDEFSEVTVETIYFGGGTPSLLSLEELQNIIAVVYQEYKVIATPEITLEANPDDLTEEKIIALSKSPVNRLSIGIQSFFEEDLEMMNRAHNAKEAQLCLTIAKQYFDNITIDLIYGIPGMSMERWQQNIEYALAHKIPHISCYALTVEPQTALEKLIEKGRVAPVKDSLALAHFEYLIEALEKEGFEHYEFSNFGKSEYYSKNNTAYWLGKKYIGIGPSAHSYNGKDRSWNINNNIKYIKAITENELPSEIEELTTEDRYNEYVMTGLRTKWGVSLTRIKEEFGIKYQEYISAQMQYHLKEKVLNLDKDILTITKRGKFLSDGIAADLFFVD